MLAPALAAVLLAGCFGATAPPPADDATPMGPPLLSCPDPCGVAIDRGIRWEPSVAANPTNARHLVASSQDQTPDDATGTGRSWGLSHVTLDGGATWRTGRLPGGLEGDRTHPLYPYAWMDDSAVAFLPDGTLLWSAIAKEPSGEVVPSGVGASLVVLRSTDGGLSFSDVVFVAEGKGWRGPNGAFGQDLGGPGAAWEFHDKPWFAIAPDGLALLAWDVVYRGHPKCPDPFVTEECTEVVHATSTDGGRTWTPPTLIAGGGIHSGAYPLVRADGAWVVSYRDTTRSEAVVARSTDQGATWTTTVVDKTTKFPVLASAQGPTGAERLYMAYPQRDGHHDGTQVVTLRWSDDGGTTWSDALALDAPEAEGRTNPAIAALDGGVVVTFWHPLAEGAELRAVAYRNDTLSQPLVLGVTEGPTSETGDYMGIAALPEGGAFAVWNAREGEGMVVAGARVEVG